ncbi:MAG: hypothetical protein V4738_12125 [Pseudomonadota bacterium]
MFKQRAIAALGIAILTSLSVGGVQAKQPGERALKNAEVFVDQPDNLATRIKVRTDAKGMFEVTNLKPGMYRIVVQTGEPPRDKNGKNLAENDYVGPQGLRGAVRWGEERKQYGDINYVTLAMESTRSTGPFSQNQKLVNGRTMGVFVTVYSNTEVLKGRVTGEP